MKSTTQGWIQKVVVLIVLIGAFYLSTIRPGESESLGDDFAMYIHEAKNIALGVDYHQTGYIYEKEYAELGPKAYPPVFPLLLAGVYKAFGLNLTAMKIEVILLFLAALLAVALTFRDELSTKQVLALVAMIGFSPYFWNYKENIVSEFPFLLFAYLSLFLIHRTYEQGGSRTYSNAALAGLAMWAAYGTRSVGICLVGALWLRDALRLRKLSPYSIVATAVFLLGAGVEMLFVQTEASYLDQFRGAPALFSHAIGYLKSLSVLWDNGYSLLLRVAVLALLSAFALIGFAARLRRGAGIFEAFSLAYLAVIVLWPAPSDRLLIPLVPLYLFYILIGFDAAMARAVAWQRIAAVGLVVATIALSYAGKYSKLNYGSLDGLDTAEAHALFDFVSKTDANDIFIFRRPRALALFTNRSAAAYYWTPTGDELWKKFCELHATHIVTGTLDDAPLVGAHRGFFTTFADKYAGDLQEVYSNAQFKVYRITRRCGAAMNITPAKTELPPLGLNAFTTSGITQETGF
jgi:hypothetical protein